MLSPPLDWIERIIRIDSTTERSNRAVADFLTPLMKDAGLTIHEQVVHENGIEFVNLVGANAPLDNPDLIVFNTHLDTVQPGDAELWTKTGGDPFRATWIQDRIYGLGVADVKLDILCKIFAFGKVRPKSPVAIVGTFGEERGLVGVAHLSKIPGFRPKWAVVGEPSNLEIIYAHKGHLIFEIRLPLEAQPKTVRKTFKGTAAHSATPHLGDNAVRKGLRSIQDEKRGVVAIQGGADTNRVPDKAIFEISEALTPATERLFQLLARFDEFGEAIQQWPDRAFDPSVNTLSLNVARMEGNVLVLTHDIRVLPGADPRVMQERLKEIAKSAGATYHLLELDPPLTGRGKDGLIELAKRSLKSAGIRPQLNTKPTATEAAIYQQMGTPAIVFGPGVSTGNVHKPNESNTLQQLQSATRFYSLLLQNLAEVG